MLEPNWLSEPVDLTAEQQASVSDLQKYEGGRLLVAKLKSMERDLYLAALNDVADAVTMAHLQGGGKVLQQILMLFEEEPKDAGDGTDDTGTN